MAVYVTSDLHGYAVEAFKGHLQSVGFSEDDWLYILGDVIDRNGDGGIAMLRWLLEQPNVQLLRGNHEQMMLSSAWMLETITEESVDALSDENLENANRWLANGAEPTLSSIKRLLRTRPETVEAIMDYLRDTPLFESVEIGGRAFFLCHSGLGNFSKSKRLSEYSENELLWNRPTKEDRYFENVLTVLGHTPTWYYGCEGRAFKTETWIDIDVGSADGAPPMLLRLDDMKEFYF